MYCSFPGKSGKEDRLHQDDDGDPHATYHRSIHELTCFDRHSKMATDGLRKCPECDEDLRPLMGGGKKR
jgi:hypothetical protein